MNQIPRRILMSTDAVGGVWQYACSLAGALAGHGYETLLVVLGPSPDASQREEAQALAGIRLIESGLPLDWLADGADLVRHAGQALAKLAASEKCDLVHLNSPLLAAEVRFPVPVVGVAHGCVGTWWEAARSGPLDPSFAWHNEMTARGLHECDLIVAPTAAYARTLQRRYDLSRNFEVVHNGRNLRSTRDVTCEVSNETAFAFTAGRLWDDVKNTMVLDTAAQALSFPFYAAGKVRGPAGERTDPRHLKLLGQLPEAHVARWLAARPVFVSAARFEPFGLAVLEAAQAGCPLVLADIPTFRELWDGAARFVPVDDAGVYAEVAGEILSQETVRRRLGDAARERAARYSAQTMSAAMVRLYESLLQQKEAA